MDAAAATYHMIGIDATATRIFSVSDDNEDDEFGMIMLSLKD